MPRILIVEDDSGDIDALRSVIVKRMTVNGLRSAHCSIEEIDAIEEALYRYWFKVVCKQILNSRIFINGVIAYFDNVLEYLLEQQGKLSQTALLEQLKCKDKIKALHKPIHIIPHSLHPSESVAH